jgi:hypothetical protein
MNKTYIAYKLDLMGDMPKSPFEFMIEDVLNLTGYYHNYSDHAHYLLSQNQALDSINSVEGIYTGVKASNYIDAAKKIMLSKQTRPFPYTFITFECLETGNTFCTIIGYNKDYTLLKTIKINGTPHDIFHKTYNNSQLIMTVNKFLSFGKLNANGTVLDIKFKKWISKYE